ncbi:hypothetical protein Tco_1462530, partial [Tanacetum coccineum]
SEMGSIPRITELGDIINDMQIHHQADIENLQDSIIELKNLLRKVVLNTKAIPLSTLLFLIALFISSSSSSSFIICIIIGYHSHYVLSFVDRMPPKRASTSESPAMTQDAIRKLSCIKVDLGFVSPDNVEECIRLIDEFCLLLKEHRSKEDKLEVLTMFVGKAVPVTFR